MKLLSTSCLFALVFFAPLPVSAQFGGLFRSSVDVENIGVREMTKKLAVQINAVEAAKQKGETPPEADFVVVDVRSPKEMSLSIIPGAITKKQFEANREKYEDRLVIPYCLSGVRSARFAQQLAKDGIETKNFKGSILKWVQEELPLVTLDGKPTKRVYLDPERYDLPSQYEAITP